MKSRASNLILSSVLALLLLIGMLYWSAYQRSNFFAEISAQTYAAEVEATVRATITK